MKALEKSTERAVVEWARQRNIMHLKLNVMGRRGYPDHIFWIDGGRPALIEFKRLGKRPRKLQQHIIGILEELNYDVCYTDKKEEAIAFLEGCVQKAFGKKAKKLPKTRG